jgi:hypothetical protein
MNTLDMLTYRKGIKTQRQVRILTQGEDTLVVDFGELEGHKFVSKYYMLLSNHQLTEVGVNAALMAWLEYDEANFNHPELTILDSEVD